MSTRWEYCQVVVSIGDQTGLVQFYSAKGVILTDVPAIPSGANQPGDISATFALLGFAGWELETSVMQLDGVPVHYFKREMQPGRPINDAFTPEAVRQAIEASIPLHPLGQDGGKIHPGLSVM